MYKKYDNGTCNSNANFQKYICTDIDNPERVRETGKFNNNDDKQRHKCQKADGNWVAAGTGKRRCKNYLKKYVDIDKENNRSFCKDF